tara:strand:+ start:2190 stop:2465 length:276 start_codon:yes stop_codon:yes gene_type:complete
MARDFMLEWQRSAHSPSRKTQPALCNYCRNKWVPAEEWDLPGHPARPKERKRYSQPLKYCKECREKVLNKTKKKEERKSQCIKENGTTSET